MTANNPMFDQLENFMFGKGSDLESKQYDVERLMSSVKKIHWDIYKQAGDVIDTFNKDYLHEIDILIDYTISAEKKIAKRSTQANRTQPNIQSAESDGGAHIISQPGCEGEGTMKKIAVASVIPLDELKHAVDNLVEYSNAKAIFTLLGTIITILIGPLTTVTWAFILFTLINFVMRIVANKFKNQDDYIRLQRNIGMFLWSYILLAIGNTLGGFVSFNGLPAGTFPAFILVVLVWTELRGIVENAKIAKLNVPFILERIVNIKDKKTENDIDSPF